MTFHYRWEPRWPAFAIGFTRTRGSDRYNVFNIILWPLVLEVLW